MARARNIVFLGSKSLGISCINILRQVAGDRLQACVTIDDRGDFRNAYDQFQAFCQNYSIPLMVCRNRQEADALLMRLSADVVFVCGWYWILSKEILDAAAIGYLGLHNSLLPAYRGSSPLNWQIINGEREIGWTLFTLTEGMDEGDIWLQQRLQISTSENVGDILCRIESSVVDALTMHLPAILNGAALPTPQSEGGVSYCAARLPEDGLIDWEKPACVIHDFIRGQAKPYPGAFTFVDNRKLTVWKSQMLPTQVYATPGQVLRLCPEGVEVACGRNTSLLITHGGLEGEDVPARKLIKTVKTRFRNAAQ